MPEDNQPGVWCRADNTFYYLETGPAAGRNSIERLKRILTQRGLIKFNKDDRNDRTFVIKVVTVQAAKEAGYEIKPVYINQHVKAVIEAQQAGEDPGTGGVNPWE